MEVESPQLIIPYTLASNDVMSVELGHFLMTNKFERKEFDSHLVKWGVFDMRFLNTNISTKRNNVVYPVLLDIVIDVTLDMPVVPNPQVPQMKVIIYFTALTLTKI